MPKREVWLSTSNAFTWEDPLKKGPTQREGGQVVTGGAQHWIVTVGEFKYQAGNVGGMNRADITAANPSRAGSSKIGMTDRTDAQIAAFIEVWNTELGGSMRYDLLGNSCQTFGTWLVRWLCEGDGKLPNQGGVTQFMDGNNYVLSAGVGEVACASADGAKAALSGPAVGYQGGKDKGAWVQAEVFKADAGFDTPLGHVGANICPNANTGVGMRNGNAEAAVLGWGGKVGKDGVGVRSPLGGVDCSIM